MHREADTCGGTGSHFVPMREPPSSWRCGEEKREESKKNLFHGTLLNWSTFIRTWTFHKHFLYYFNRFDLAFLSLTTTIFLKQLPPLDVSGQQQINNYFNQFSFSSRKLRSDDLCSGAFFQWKQWDWPYFEIKHLKSGLPFSNPPPFMSTQLITSFRTKATFITDVMIRTHLWTKTKWTHSDFLAILWKSMTEMLPGVSCMPFTLLNIPGPTPFMKEPW